MSLGRINTWTALSVLAGTALAGFCLAGAAIAWRAARLPVMDLAPKPALTRLVVAAGRTAAYAVVGL